MHARYLLCIMFTRLTCRATYRNNARRTMARIILGAGMRANCRFENQCVRFSSIGVLVFHSFLPGIYIEAITGCEFITRLGAPSDSMEIPLARWINRLFAIWVSAVIYGICSKFPTAFLSITAIILYGFHSDAKSFTRSFFYLTMERLETNNKYRKLYFETWQWQLSSRDAASSARLCRTVSSAPRTPAWTAAGWPSITPSSPTPRTARSSTSAWTAWRRASRDAATAPFTTRSSRGATHPRTCPDGELFLYFLSYCYSRVLINNKIYKGFMIFLHLFHRKEKANEMLFQPRIRMKKSFDWTSWSVKVNVFKNIK